MDRIEDSGSSGRGSIPRGGTVVNPPENIPGRVLKFKPKSEVYIAPVAPVSCDSFTVV